MRVKILLTVSFAAAAVLLGVFSAGAVDIGECESSCAKDLGGIASSLCQRACMDGMADGQCTYKSDGCCNEYFWFLDPDCGGGCSSGDLEALEARINLLEEALASQQGIVDSLEAKLAYLRVEEGEIKGLSGPHLIVEGVNMHIRSGSGATDDGGLPLGLGNLIVGYNEPPGAPAGGRRGSHNIVSGVGHTYPSYGGFVTGENNAVHGEFSVALGGWWNETVSWGDVITGGSYNRADNGFVAGGSGNYAASGSVFGGIANRAETGEVFGGRHNRAANWGLVVGGSDNEATGFFSVVTGGAFNAAAGLLSKVSGGRDNLASGEHSTVSGGAGRTSAGNDDWVAGSLLQDH